VTGITTSNITIDNLHVDVTFENTIGTSDCTGVNGASITLTGSLAGGQWSGNAAGQRAAVFANDEGLTSHGPTGSSTVTVSGTIKSTTALTLT
jgi:hypothetical protein